MLHEFEIAGITLDTDSKTPILVLKSESRNVTIPIWIGLLEASSIASALQNISFDRPMTHDLFKNFLDLLQIGVERVEVCDLEDNTFFARIYFHSTEKNFSMDARPSDAIAIAVRFKAPIFVDDKVIDNFKPDERAEAMDKTEEGEKWAEYLKKLDPDDFGQV